MIDFTDAIAEEWGGKPFIDLKKGWDYILQKYPQVDPDRAVATGASWGGYAIKYSFPHFTRVYKLNWPLVGYRVIPNTVSTSR
jgi:hypothetical protein